MLESCNLAVEFYIDSNFVLVIPTLQLPENKVYGILVLWFRKFVEWSLEIFIKYSSLISILYS